MSNSRSSESNLESIESIISIRTQMLMAVFGKKENADLVSVFKRHLNRYPTWILGKAFTRAETELERFPTVRWLVGACEQLKPSSVWKYSYKDSTDDEGIPCKIDPDPDCDVCRKSWSQHPHEKCSEVVDKLHAKFMYKPQDCPEGREFLQAMARLAEKKLAPKVDLEASAANLQAQKIFLSKQGPK